MDGIKLYTIVEEQLFQFNRTGFFQLIFVNSGVAKLKLDMKDHIFRADEILMILPNTETEIETYADTKVLWISFDINVIQIDGRNFVGDIFRLFVSQNKYQRTKVSAETFDNIQRIIPMIFEEYESDTASFEIVWAFLKIILLSLIRDYEESISIPDKNIERLQLFFYLVNEFAKKERRTTFYADKLNISTKRLNQVIQSLTNKSASFFIQEHLIMEAKRELIKGNLTVNEIAYELGFEDRAYFSRFFKKWTGTPPNNFKKVYFQKKNARLYKDGILNYMSDM